MKKANSTRKLRSHISTAATSAFNMHSVAAEGFVKREKVEAAALSSCLISISLLSTASEGSVADIHLSRRIQWMKDSAGGWKAHSSEQRVGRAGSRRTLQ